MEFMTSSLYSHLSMKFSEVYGLRTLDYYRDPQKIGFKKVVASPRCLKITEKVSFNIASEASYVYVLNGQKLIKIAKKGPI